MVSARVYGLQAGLTPGWLLASSVLMPHQPTAAAALEDPVEWATSRHNERRACGAETMAAAFRTAPSLPSRVRMPCAWARRSEVRVSTRARFFLAHWHVMQSRLAPEPRGAASKLGDVGPVLRPQGGNYIALTNIALSNHATASGAAGAAIAPGAGTSLSFPCMSAIQAARAVFLRASTEETVEECADGDLHGASTGQTYGQTP